MPPAHSSTKGWAKHLNRCSDPTLGHSPTLDSYEEPPCAPLRKQVWEPNTCPCSLLLQQDPWWSLARKNEEEEEKKHIGSDIISAVTYNSEKHRGYTGGKRRQRTQLKDQGPKWKENCVCPKHSSKERLREHLVGCIQAHLTPNAQSPESPWQHDIFLFLFR